jgi:general secretion pathway protein E
VLSTLHTNTAVGALTRLRDMGIEPFLLASSLIGVLAQRLVRVLCPHCKVPHKASSMEAAFLGLKDAQTFNAAGCDQCNQTGYKGRTGIYELLTVDDKVRQLIHAEATEETIVQTIRPTTRSIRDDGIRRVREGETTLEEVLRVTQEE